MYKSYNNNSRSVLSGTGQRWTKWALRCDKSQGYTIQCSCKAYGDGKGGGGVFWISNPQSAPRYKASDNDNSY